MDLVHAISLAVIQGLTEFLPVSSSGHLVLFQHFFKVEEATVFFDIVLHVGTLVAVFAYYRRDILALLAGLRSKPGNTFQADPGNSNSQWEKLGSWHQVFLIVVGMIPAGLVGVFGKDFIESVFHQPKLVGVMLLVTAALLATSRWTQARAAGGLTPVKALVIGCAQAFAILPGISRSGATISIALALGVRVEDAARFSFLLAIPAIMGALVLKLGDIQVDALDWTSYGVGFAISAVVGLAALAGLIQLLVRGRLIWFSAWCILSGTLALIFL